MNVKEYIELKLAGKEGFNVADIIKATGKTRQYINRILQQYQQTNQLTLVEKTNRARYIPTTTKAIIKAKKEELSWTRKLHNKNLSEDLILEKTKHETGIFFQLKENIQRIVDYAFTEIVNNAIEHSRSKTIVTSMQRTNDGIFFSVIDRGIGIFKNIKNKKKLAAEIDAIQELVKRKQTTMPEAHSGEGIFFTSRIADKFSIKSWKKN